MYIRQFRGLLDADDNLVVMSLMQARAPTQPKHGCTVHRQGIMYYTTKNNPHLMSFLVGPDHA